MKQASDWLSIADAIQQAAATASAEDLPELLAELERAKATAYARLLTAPKNGEGDLLTAGEVADLLKVDRRWPYRHAEELGAVRLSEKCLRFPRKGIQSFMQKRGS